MGGRRFKPCRGVFDSLGMPSDALFEVRLK